MNDSSRLRAGDVIRFEGKPCRVVRVNDCAAVIAVTKQPREFTTLFGVRVRIQPKPALVQISPNSEIEILNRKSHRPRLLDPGRLFSHRPSQPLPGQAASFCSF